MATWMPAGFAIGDQPIASVATVQQHPIGKRVWARSETYGWGEFVYLKGGTSVDIGDWVTYSMLSGLTVVSAADAVGPVALSQATNTLTTNYSWFQIWGLSSTGNAAGAIAINTQCYSAGSGAVDDAVVDGDMIHNFLCVSTVTGSGATTGAGCFFMWYPYQDNIAGND